MAKIRFYYCICSSLCKTPSNYSRVMYTAWYIWSYQIISQPLSLSPLTVCRFSPAKKCLSLQLNSNPQKHDKKKSLRAATVLKTGKLGLQTRRVWKTKRQVWPSFHRAVGSMSEALAATSWRSLWALGVKRDDQVAGGTISGEKTGLGGWMLVGVFCIVLWCFVFFWV